MLMYVWLIYMTVAGEVDTIEILAGRDIHDVVEAIKVQAIRKAVAAGADPGAPCRLHIRSARSEI